MTSRATPRFWAAYAELPREVRDAARKAYALFRHDPKHPSLQFKKVHARDAIYSVRVTMAHRALAVVQDDQVVWFWIGNHADYDRLLNRR